MKVLDNVSFIINRDDKVAFVGSDELAKTTLFKILVGELEPDSGSYKWGITTTQAYFPKDNTKDFDCEDIIVDWLMQFSPEKDVTYVRGFLGRMLFAGDDGVKKVKVLSGGEKVRVMLSKMMIMGANVLIMDEPTNHLDMESITALNNGMITGGVQVDEIYEAEDGVKTVYDPSHPDADEEGYVDLPNINLVEEMVGMISASKAYEANATVAENVKTMMQSAMNI